MKVGKYDSVMYHGCTSDRMRLGMIDMIDRKRRALMLSFLSDPLLRINIHNIPCSGRDYELVLFRSNPNFVVRRLL